MSDYLINSCLLYLSRHLIRISYLKKTNCTTLSHIVCCYRTHRFRSETLNLHNNGMTTGDLFFSRGLQVRSLIGYYTTYLMVTVDVDTRANNYGNPWNVFENFFSSTMFARCRVHSGFNNIDHRWRSDYIPSKTWDVGWHIFWKQSR